MITASFKKDFGMTPHELLEASLAACTTLTLKMYAGRKEWPLEDVVTTVKVLSENGETNEISRVIELKGNLDPDMRARLLDIAGKCPMHKFISKKSDIKTELV